MIKQHNMGIIQEHQQYLTDDHDNNTADIDQDDLMTEIPLNQFHQLKEMKIKELNGERMMHDVDTSLRQLVKSTVEHLNKIIFGKY